MTVPGGWYFAKTLLGCDPGKDINKRALYCGPRKIATFNDSMEKWPPKLDDLLQKVCDNLNRIGKKTGTYIE